MAGMEDWKELSQGPAPQGCCYEPWTARCFGQMVYLSLVLTQPAPPGRTQLGDGEARKIGEQSSEGMWHQRKAKLGLTDDGTPLQLKRL